MKERSHVGLPCQLNIQFVTGHPQPHLC